MVVDEWGENHRAQWASQNFTHKSLGCKDDALGTMIQKIIDVASRTPGCAFDSGNWTIADRHNGGCVDPDLVRLADKMRRSSGLTDVELQATALHLCGGVAGMLERWDDIDACIIMGPRDASGRVPDPPYHTPTDPEEDDCVQRVCGAIVLSAAYFDEEPIPAGSCLFWKGEFGHRLTARDNQCGYAVPCGFKLVPKGYTGPTSYGTKARLLAGVMADACEPTNVEGVFLCPWVEVAHMRFIQHEGRIGGGRELNEKNDRALYNANPSVWIPLLRSNYTAMSEPGGGLDSAVSALLTGEQVLSLVGVRVCEGGVQHKLKLPAYATGGGGAKDVKEVTLNGSRLFIVTPRIMPPKKNAPPS